MTRWALSLVFVLTASVACEFGIGDNRTPTPIPPGAAFAVGAPTVVPTATPDAILTVTPTATATPIPLPVGSFSADSLTGTAPLIVQFTNMSQGPITSLEWDFGDGTTSSDEAPTHRYTIAGTYDVELTASGPGGSDTRIISELITVDPGAITSLEISPESVTLTVEEGVDFIAVAQDEFGNVVPSSVDWGTDGAAGSLNDSGGFTAGAKAGDFPETVKVSLQAESGELISLASITVEPGPVAEVTLQPSGVSLNIGDSQDFTVVVRDKFANQISDALISWKSDTNVGIVDTDGKFTAGTKAGSFPNSVTVEVVKGSFRATEAAAVSIAPGPLDKIEVNPSPAIIGLRDSLDLIPRGFDQYTNEILGLAFLWRAPPGVSLSTNGNLRASNIEDQIEVEVSASFKNSKRIALVPVVVLDLPFIVRSGFPADIAPGQDALAIQGEIIGGRLKDIATISMGASIHAVSSGLHGTEPCEGDTFRLPCSDPRDVIDRDNAYSAYPPGGERGTFMFGPHNPQSIIIDLGQVRQLEIIGSVFDHTGTYGQGLDSFGVWVSENGSDYATVSGSPIRDPEPISFFILDSPVMARYVAYYFGNCLGIWCDNGSRIMEVYAIETFR